MSLTVYTVVRLVFLSPFLSCLIHAVAGRTLPAGERGSAAGSLLSSHCQERAARNLVQSFTFGAPGVGGGHRHARRGRPSAGGFLLSRAALA
jgi:hypothetical protein